MVATPPVIATPTGEAESNAGRRLVARAMWIGLWVWPSFVLLDLYMCFVAYPGAPCGLCGPQQLQAAHHRSEPPALRLPRTDPLTGPADAEAFWKRLEKARFG